MVSGKHVFCEKSITVNSRQLEECVAIAQEKGLVICDGMTLLHIPLYKELKAVYYSPNADNVPELMDTFLKSANFEGTSVKESLYGKKA